MTTEQNKKFVRNHFEEFVNRLTRPGGNQFLVIAAGGHAKVSEESQSDAVIAFTLLWTG